MKIIQLIQKPQRRGAEIFAAQLAEELTKKGHEVMVVSIFKGDTELRFLDNQVDLNRMPKQRFVDIRAWHKFSQIIKEFEPHLIQANAADTLKFAVFSKKLFHWKTPIVYRNANQMGDFIRGRLHRALNQWLLNATTAVVSVSESSRRDFHHTFKYQNRISSIISIGIAPGEIKDKIAEPIRITGLPENYLIQIGSLVPEKDPLGLLDLFSKIMKEFSDLNLLFVGSGPLEFQLKVAIRKKGLENQVKLVPNQTNIFPVLARAKGLLVHSRIEGLPGVILEAMYCRVPVVAYDVGGIGEVLIHKQTGWLVPKNDQFEFIQAIREILQSTPNQLDAITSHARFLVEKHYHLNTIVQRFEELYEKVI
ncbi:glycosyltransferase [Negadavirga shengliensis]|uniref:Glycosyltransferase n=1 Tax=Negadavirga shengliensis TaxID=1389218 RepID=A0ABV9T637_9BACT